MNKDDKDSVYIKNLSPDFIDAYMELLKDPEIHKTTQPYEEPREFTKEELLNWLQKINKATDRKDFAILKSSDDEFVGEVVINQVQGSTANIRIIIGSKHWGKGYGYSAMKQAIDYGFDHMNLEEITLSVFHINPRGLALYKKLGFEEVEQSVYKGFPETLMRIRRPSDI